MQSDLVSFSSIAGKALSLGGLGGAASLTGLLAMAKATADTADEVGKLAQRVGVSTEALSKLQYAAALNDATSSELEKGLSKLNGAIAELASGAGGSAAAALQALGVEAVDAEGKVRGADAVFADLATRFAAMADGPEKTAAAVKIFGEQVGRALIPMLNNGAAGLQALGEEAEKLGVVIGGDLARASAQFNDDLERMAKLAQGAKIAVGQELIPVLNEYLTRILDAKNAGVGLSPDVVFGTGLRDVESTIERLQKQIAELRTGRSIKAGLLATFGDLEGEIKRLENAIKYFEAQRARQRGEAQKQESDTANLQRTQGALQSEMARLATLRAQKEREASSEALKGAVALKAALEAAWKASTEGAQAAAAEARNLLQAADQALTERSQQAQARRNRSNQLPEDSPFASMAGATSPRVLLDEARRAATMAQNAAYHAPAERAEELAQNALKLAKEAEAVASAMEDDNYAAWMLDQIGKVEQAAIKAQSTIAEGKARESEETAAAQQEQLEAAEERIAELRAALESPVNIDADIAEAVSKIKALNLELETLRDKTVTVTVNRVDAGGDLPGFARGGYTGAGSKYQAAGIVHAGEFVVRREALLQPGVLAYLEQLNRSGRLPGYAAGGLVRNIPTGAIVPRAAQSAPRGADVHVHLPTGQTAVIPTDEATAQAVARIFKRAALVRGGRK
ncbi:hypothetical protein C8261_08710 [Pseudothauera lacus]|uniref:Uncharacterized protein n=1 Tax=Pseudothauera lacus TaxID=2136175 RepID=A0A2T4IF27_9RHOO|nr:hypothetical protein C8261_08710 [Pseudothauera lacus]